MSEPKHICPFWNKTCEDARKELQAQGADCDFITKIVVATPSIIVGAPPAMSQADICTIRAIQGSLNSLHEGLNLIIQLLGAKRGPTAPPFGKG